MIVAYYVLGAAVAAWLTVGNPHLDWSLSLLVLPCMFFVHVSYTVFWAKRNRNNPCFRSNEPNCLACHNDIGLVRRFSHRRFCSDEHEQLYLAELEKIALARLESARIDAQNAIPEVVSERARSNV